MELQYLGCLPQESHIRQRIVIEGPSIDCLQPVTGKVQLGHIYVHAYIHTYIPNGEDHGLYIIILESVPPDSYDTPEIESMLAKVKQTIQ